MNREEHLEWCKKRALEYIDRGDIANGITSMMSDLNKHEGTAIKPGGIISALGLNAAISNDITEARRFIEGFN